MPGLFSSPSSGAISAQRSSEIRLIVGNFFFMAEPLRDITLSSPMSDCLGHQMYFWDRLLISHMSVYVKAYAACQKAVFNRDS